MFREMTNNNSDIEIFSKSQILRLWDVFFLGPFLILAGSVGKNHIMIKTGLIISGALTIIYNGRNFLLNQKQKRALRESKI